jgi:2-oxoacid:acceptor oxidoreductase gamma subunit (pyruvate/2-ketoisovalerate family)
MKEMRFHGRGGQGTVIGAEMLASAFILEGKYASSFPSFGPERRGAPVAAFLRFDDKPIRETHQIYEPDCIIVLDPFQAKLTTIFNGLKDRGVAILNTPRQRLENCPTTLSLIGLVDATSLALEEIGRGIVNTCMLGVIAKVTGWVSLNSVISSLEMHFHGELLKTNAKLARRGYESVKIMTPGSI